ncbi:metal-dependent hydrolase [Primorskyibacter sp. S187A]|uniref:metal-dependent hydrolase n=1 Tax=Primorskyibacter sp. S187A TaxID=3415130 RepID=UPI003C7C0AC3
MIIGHLPAGYLLASALDKSFDEDPLIWWAILVGAVLPDLDMVWFFLVDRGAVHHHSYITHDPTLWVAVFLLGLTLSSRALIGLGLGTLLHVALDTPLGAICWGYGNLSLCGPAIVVPATQSHWILSFLLHWTFAVELVVVALAIRVYWKRPRSSE